MNFESEPRNPVKVHGISLDFPQLLFISYLMSFPLEVEIYDFFRRSVMLGGVVLGQTHKECFSETQWSDSLLRQTCKRTCNEGFLVNDRHVCIGPLYIALLSSVCCDSISLDSGALAEWCQLLQTHTDFSKTYSLTC